VRRAAPFRTLTREGFDDCLVYLFGRDRADKSWLPPRLAGDADSFTVIDTRTSRLLRRNLGTILAEETTTVALLHTQESPSNQPEARVGSYYTYCAPLLAIGEVDRRFAETLLPGDRFLLDGRCLEVRRQEGGKLLVDEVPGRPAVPRWSGAGGTLSPELAQRLYLLRVRAAEALHDGPEMLLRLLMNDYGLDGMTAAVLAEYFERQDALSEIPDAGGILIEIVGNRIATELYIHTPLNRPANDALARVAVHRLVRDCQRRADCIVADLGFALLIRGEVTKPGDLTRIVLDHRRFVDDLEEALAESPALRERFRCVAMTGLMLLRNPLGGQRRVGGRSWGERQLFDRVRNHDTDFVLLRQARRELKAELYDADAARRFAATLDDQPLKCRYLYRQSPFTEAWTQTWSGSTEEAASPADALRRLHEVLTASGGRHARAE